MRGAWQIAIVLTAATFFSCIAPQHTQMVGVDAWSWDSAKSISYNNNDTLTLRNLNIALRYNEDFKLATLPLKIAVTTPDARYFEEIVELQLQHPRTALSVATTESLPYRADVILSQKGAYTFSFEPQSVVRGVEAIGIEIK